jgi:hypothetical protein
LVQVVCAWPWTWSTAPRAPWIIDPIIGIDCYFPTGPGVKLREELKMDDEQVDAARQRGELAKCLVVRCYVSKSVFGHVIPRKGPDENGVVVDKILKDLEWLGHTRVIVTADKIGRAHV